FAQATSIARSMVCEWGMSEKLGKVSYDTRSETGIYMGLGYQEKTYSEETARAIDEEIRAIIDEAYRRAKEIITTHRKEVQLMADMLIEFETLDAEDVKKILSGEWSVEDKRAKLKKVSELHRKKMTKDLSEEPEAPKDELPTPA